MNRKDYLAVASVIRADVNATNDEAAIDSLKRIAYSIAVCFEKNDSGFNRRVFIDDCGFLRSRLASAIRPPEHNCIICLYDDHFEIAGPFSTNEALVAWGQRWQAEHDDDPRWQSIYLAEPQGAGMDFDGKYIHSITVHTPEA